MLHLICLKQCEHVQPPPYAGPCECRYDPAAPVDIQQRVASGTCPAGRFDDPVARYAARPTYPIPDDYEATPTNATAGGCGCKK
jgi:hypothetical protein